ncbi:hypothetical protein BC828DRAFT_387406 [Blastocladiella britannica]|nr:hypothetical protein BC828DRAFT_387406 [Blastocladiella britannica]
MAPAPPSLTAAELKLIVEKLSRPPFSKPNLSVIALHDDLPYPDLIQLLSTAIALVDSRTPDTPHAVDIRLEQPHVTAARISDFVANSLPYKWGTVDEIAGKLVAGDDRGYILHILHFLLQDLPALQGQAYKSRFLRSIELPLEFSGDEKIQELICQLQERQEEFTAALNQAEEMHASSQQTADLRRDISQMEEEKVLVQGKIQRMQRKLQDIPNSAEWLGAARKLRKEQDRESNLSGRTRDLRAQLAAADDRLNLLRPRATDARGLANADPASLLERLRADVATNTYMANEKLPRDVADAEAAVALLEHTLQGEIMSLADTIKLEHELEGLAEQVTEVTEKKILTHNSQDKLSLFRQQLAVVHNKKAATAERLRENMAQLEDLRGKHAAAVAAADANPSAVPRGEEFKSYVAALRIKSQAYKQRRTDLAAATAELAVAVRTREILAAKRTAADKTLRALEQRHGVSGLRATRGALESVSERKGELDVAKAATVDELSDLVAALTKAVASKKVVLAPRVAELKQQRAQLSELEAVHAERKRGYDAAVAGPEADCAQLVADARTLRAESVVDESKWHLASMQQRLVDVRMDGVLREMKVYIGNAEDADPAVRRAGFKTWRDLYQRKLLETEAAGRQTKEALRVVNERHTGNVMQMQLFGSIKAVLAARKEANQQLLSGKKSSGARGTSGGGGRDGEEFLSATEQRLVIG